MDRSIQTCGIEIFFFIFRDMMVAEFFLLKLVKMESVILQSCYVVDCSFWKPNWLERRWSIVIYMFGVESVFREL